MIQTVSEYLNNMHMGPWGPVHAILKTVNIAQDDLLLPGAECLCDCLSRAEKYHEMLSDKFGTLDRGFSNEISIAIKNEGKNAAEEVLKVYLTYRHQYEFIFTTDDGEIDLYQLVAKYLTLRRQTDFALTMTEDSARAKLTKDEQNVVRAMNQNIICTLREMQTQRNLTPVPQHLSSSEKIRILKTVYMQTPREITLTSDEIRTAIFICLERKLFN